MCTNKVPACLPLQRAEREGFVDEFLRNVFPPIYRFGTGDVTDKNGNQSGQLDVVIEYPFAPTLPTVGGTSPTRLYLADGVAAVIEVKSDLAAQWAEVERTANKLATVKRDAASVGMWMGPINPQPAIPLFAVGYTGWSTENPIRKKLAGNSEIAGVLNIDPPIFVGSGGAPHWLGNGALWGLITQVHRHIASVQASYYDPMDYLL